MFGIDFFIVLGIDFGVVVIGLFVFVEIEGGCGFEVDDSG